jgi:hypothetical protein
MTHRSVGTTTAMKFPLRQVANSFQADRPARPRHRSRQSQLTAKPQVRIGAKVPRSLGFRVFTAGGPTPYSSERRSANLSTSLVRSEASPGETPVARVNTGNPPVTGGLTPVGAPCTPPGRTWISRPFFSLLRSPEERWTQPAGVGGRSVNDGRGPRIGRFASEIGHRGLESICLTLRAADVPRRAKFAAIDAEFDPSIHTPFVGDRERLALAAIGGLWSAVGPPVRPVALLPGGGDRELAAGAITLAPGHHTIVSCGKSRIGSRDREGSGPTSPTRFSRKPAGFGRADGILPTTSQRG